MKKILSFVLVLAMIASMMCISVSAAEENTLTSGDVFHIVGGHASSSEGLAPAAFVSKENTSEIKASINGQYTSKYAVDLLYSAVTITITNNAEWDVSSLKYIGSMEYTVGDATGTLVNNKPVDRVGMFAVTNYSNEPVYVKADVTPSTEEDSISVDVFIDNKERNAPASKSIVTEYDRVAAVTVENGTDNNPGSPEITYYQAQMNCENWVSELWNLESGDTFIVAKITFEITSEVPTNNDSTSSDPGENA